MIISDDFCINDTVSGLSVKIIKGTNLNRLHIEIIGNPIVNNRDFWFDLKGDFDGTGSGCCKEKVS